MTSSLRLGLTLSTLVLLALVLAYLSGAFHPKIDAGPTAADEVSGPSFEVRVQMLDRHTPIPGTISATDETIVGARMLSAVSRVLVRAGAVVKAGDLLVELDDAGPASVLAQREQAVASASAQLQEATLNRDRAEDLFGRGALSRADYDRALTNYSVASAEVQRSRRAVAEAQVQLGYTRITAPIDGRVVETEVDPGDTVTPGQAVIKLYNPGRLRVEAVLRESLIGRVNPGDRVTAEIDVLDLSLDAVIEEVVPSADPGSRSFIIKALLPAAENVYPGMFARLHIPAGRREALLVPADYIERSGQLAFVRVQSDAQVLRRMVRVGATYPDGIEIVSGLEAGVKLVIPER